MASLDGYGLASGALENTGILNSDPVGNFNFVLTVEGIYDIPLKSVRAFQKVNQYEKIREGGVNDYVHLKRAPIQDAHTIQFERYVSASLLDPLANGAELAIPVILWLKRAANNGLTDARKNKKEYKSDDYDTSSVRLYVFTGCTVMSKEYGALDAEHSGLATEVVTMGYKELYIVPNIYTFFGGGTDIKSAGQMGELNNVDESARKDFEKKQKEEWEKAHKAHEEAATAADDKKKTDAANAKSHLAKTKKEEKKRLLKERQAKVKRKNDARKARDVRKKANEEATKKEQQKNAEKEASAKAAREKRKKENEEVTKKEAEERKRKQEEQKKK